MCTSLPSYSLLWSWVARRERIQTRRGCKKRLAPTVSTGVRRTWNKTWKKQLIATKWLVKPSKSVTSAPPSSVTDCMGHHGGSMVYISDFPFLKRNTIQLKYNNLPHLPTCCERQKANQVAKHGTWQYNKGSWDESKKENILGWTSGGKDFCWTVKMLHAHVKN